LFTAEVLDLCGAQLAPVPGFQVAIAKGPDRDAPQRVDGMADRVAHLPHLAIPSFADR